MCGIVAVWNRDGSPVDLAAFERSVGALRRRGPDDEGYLLVDTRSGRTVECAGPDTRAPMGLPRIGDLRGEHFDLALGHRRLAIVDTSSAGHQPMGVTDGARGAPGTQPGSWLVFNGMIYNFRELRAELESQGHVFRGASDTEVLLRSYEEWGEECVQRFNGAWAFALWDPRACRLLLSRDRLGIKPLVLHRGGARVAAASELKALALLPGFGRSLDSEALHHYLSLMKVPAPRTIYEKTRKLMPGQFVSITRDSLDERFYWRPGCARAEPCSEEQAIERAHALIEDSVRLRLRADVPVGTFLSGGLDSSLVSALAAGERDTSLRTYGVGVRDPGVLDESPWAEKVAAHLGATHRSLELREGLVDSICGMVELCDEPFAVSSILGIGLMAQEAARDVKVVLTGDGGDEVFAGYTDRYLGVDEVWGKQPGRLRQLSPARVRASTALVRWREIGARTRAAALLSAAFQPAARRYGDVYNLARFVFNDAEKHALYTPGFAAQARAWSTLREAGRKLPEPGTDSLRRWQLADIRTSLHDEMLTKVDKATMAWGVEARVPFLDHRLVDLGLDLPRHLKVRDGRGKWILRRLGKRYLPLEVVEREKHGFDLPLSGWLTGPLRSWVRDILSPEALRRGGFFRASSVDAVLAHHEAKPGFSSAHMVFTLLCLQLWLDQNATRAS